jgi:predicted membrane channel-forming protein YqfA (hemolysin III family)
VSDPEESQDKQLARNLNELLQELRVAQAGVQILFGFLLSITFTERYAAASGYIKTTHLITVLFATAAVALLTAPASWHRLLFRLGRREEIIEVANRLAVAGLGCLAVAMTGTVLVITEMVVGGWFAILLAILAAVGFVMLWFAMPLRKRSHGPAPERVDAAP